MRPISICFGSPLLAGMLLSAPATAASTRGWSIDEVLPERLSITASFRARYEYLSDQFGIGQQVEFRLRADVLPGNLGLEVGYAHLFAGGFIEDAPNSNGQGDTDYVYTRATVAF